MTTAKVSKPEAAVSKPKVTRSVKPGTMAAAAAPAKPVTPVDTPATSSVPARAGRPSSRLAQLTVPSMAQSVASTDAKASYSKAHAEPLIIPPLAGQIKNLANNLPDYVSVLEGKIKGVSGIIGDYNLQDALKNIANKLKEKENMDIACPICYDHYNDKDKIPRIL